MKTGTGYIICYQAFRPLWTKKNTDRLCSVFVICPLISIIKEQPDYLCRLGFSATYVGKDSKEVDDIRMGDFDYIFSSPEAIVGNAE